MIEKKCSVCDADFHVSDRYKKNANKYCSYKCYWETLKKQVPWNKGKKELQLAWNKGLKGYMEGAKNGMWKGSRVGYTGLHNWVKRKLGKPKQCEFCRKEVLNPNMIHWANKSQEYKRDLTDWLRLCYRCHREYDGLST